MTTANDRLRAAGSCRQCWLRHERGGLLLSGVSSFAERAATIEATHLRASFKTVALSLRERKAESESGVFPQFGNRLAERDGYVHRLRRF